METIDTYSPELSTIGALLLRPELMGEAVLTLTDEDFRSQQCRVVWQAMKSLFRAGKTVDVVLVKDALSGFPGAIQFLAAAMEAAPDAGNFHAHIEALRKQTMLARLREIGSQLSVCADLNDAAALMDKGNEATIRRAARERRSMEGMLRSFAQRHSSSKKPSFIPWPLKPLQKGVKVEGGKFVVIGGYPSDGKTAFALQSAITQAKANIPAAFYSFETDANTVEDRALAMMAGISMEDIQDNLIDEQGWADYAKASECYQMPFTVVAASGMTVDDIRADALAHRYRVIYVDYLQLISPSRRGGNFSRFDEVSEISRSLQQLAKTTGITVVALSQMSRPAADKKGNVPEPTMHSLRESGQIEQDADVIMLLYRKNHKDIRAPRTLSVAKNKEGRTGHWTVDFDGAHQRFAMAARQESSQLPPAKGTTKPTPVLGREEQLSIISGDDPDLPF